jgi:hypothetical protein
LFNGKRIKSDTSPNQYPENERKKIANILAAEIYTFLNQGGVLNEYRSDKIVCSKLSGSRNKSGRNRIVPAPSYIEELLNKGDNNLNIFTGTTKAPNPDYFKTIWGRFKKVSKLLEQDQTLYSFRHSGAIEIFKRTGSLSKLQKAMGHSPLDVSLIYLRGLEVSELEESDMPVISI